MYFDYTYIVYVLPALIVSLIAQAMVKSAFAKYSKISNSRGLTGADAARMILRQNGISDVAVERVAGSLTDHYDPKANVIRLSDSVYSSNSVAAVGVAAHEAGHAVQYATGYAPIKLRSAIIPITNIGSNMAMPLVILGLIFSFYPLAYAGIILFGTVVVFQLVTLPVEFNASRRAISVLSEGYLDGDELEGAKKVLTAAALTYVAALFTALANLLRLLAIVGRRDRK